MDIRCARCGQTYEIDAAKISSRGTPVSCSACAHEFLALPPVAGAAAASKADAPVLTFPAQASTVTGWSLQRAGSQHVEPCPALHLLQRAIVEDTLGARDRISPDGVRWALARDIPELQPFFAVLGAADAATDTTVVGIAGDDQDEWEIGHVPMHDDDDDRRPVTRRMPSRGGKTRWLVVVATAMLLLGAGGLAALYVAKPAMLTAPLNRWLGLVPQAAEGMVRAGYLAVQPDTHDAMERGRMFFQAASEAAPTYVEATAGLAYVQVCLAEAAQDERRWLEARLPDADRATRQTLRIELEAVQARYRGHMQQAWETLRDVLAGSPRSGSVNIVAADYYRLEGQWANMREALERAKAALPPGDPRVDYVAAAGPPAAAGAAAAAAKQPLDGILQRIPGFVRARYRLAEVKVAAGELAAAVAGLESLLQATPEHAQAQRLLVMARARLAAEAEVVPEVVPQETYASLIEKADSLRQSDQAERAIDLYRQATALDSSGPEGYTGLGWCHIDLDETDDAVVSFRNALKLAPDHAEAHMGLAEAFRMDGRNEEAVRHYRRYLDILPDGPKTAVARQMIQDLSK